MPCLQVPLQRRETEVVQRSRLEHAAHRLLRPDGGQSPPHCATSPFYHYHPSIAHDVHEQRPGERHRRHRPPISHGTGGFGYLRSAEDSTSEAPQCHQPASQAVQVERVHLPGGYRQSRLAATATGIGRAGFVPWILPGCTGIVPAGTGNPLPSDVSRAPREEDELGVDAFVHRLVSLPRSGNLHPRNRLTLWGNAPEPVPDTACAD